MVFVKLAVLASGAGTNLQAVIDGCRSGEIPAEVALVLSDRPTAGALQRASAAGIPTHVVRPREFDDRTACDAAISTACAEAGAGLVVLAGFMRLLGPAFLGRWAGRCINVHPSLLPAFPGIDAPAQALAYGVRLTGCTVHFVDEGTDSGPIILQRAVPVREDDDVDSLSARILEEEHRAYVEAIALHASGLLVVTGRRVHILGEGKEQ